MDRFARGCLVVLLVASQTQCGVSAAPAPAPAKTAPPSQRYMDLAPSQARASAPLPPDTLIDARRIDADLELLGYALDRGYVGRHVVPDASYQAMQRAIDALRGAPRTVGALCDALGDALWEIPDAHLAARERLAADSRRRCGERAKAARRKPGVGTPYGADETKRPFVIEALAVGHARIGVVAIHRLPAANDPSWGEYDQWTSDLGGLDALVVDLRGNEGGDDSRGLQLARVLTDGSGATAVTRIRERWTPEAFTLLLNGLDQSARLPDGTLPEWAAPRYAAHAHARVEAQLHPGDDHVREATKPTPPGPKAYAGNIAVLVDAACASSCESTLQALRRHPRARVFGERTAGYVSFGEVGSLILPESGIELAIPTKYFELEGGRMLDKIGFEPDVAVASGKDAFDVAAAWVLEGLDAARIVPPREYVVPEALRAKEKARLSAFGLTIPPEGIVLERPFAEPLSRRSFVVPGLWLGRSQPRLVYAPALRADIDALEVVMTHAYGGYERAKKRGFDWSGWFTGWRKRLDETGPRFVFIDEAFEPVRKLQAFQLDNHTTIPLTARFGSGSHVDRLSGEPKGPCDAFRDKEGRESPIDPKDRGQSPRNTDRFDGRDVAKVWWIARPAKRGEMTAIRCGGVWSPITPVVQPDYKDAIARIKELAGQENDRPIAKHLSESVALLRFPTFSKTNSEIIARERASWEKPTGKEKAIVVDLRKNEGGDAAWWALEGWLSKDDREKLDGFDRRIGASCLYPALRWGYTSQSSFWLKPPITDGMRSNLGFGIGELQKKDDAACPARFTFEHARQHYADKRPPPRAGKPRVVVLVDGGCGSDCEAMTEGLRRLPESVIVGVNTYGVVEYIQPGYSVLPNTQLPFRIALGTSDPYGDARSLDGYGLDVDMLLDGVDGVDVWKKESILRLVARLSTP